MTKPAKLNTKLLLAAIAGMAVAGLWGLYAMAPKPPGEAEPGPAGELRIWDRARPLPDATFSDAAGHQVRLSDYRGKVLLVNFWATWCEPCRIEMPALSALQAKLSGPSFTVLAVSGDRTGKEAVAPFIAANKLENLPVLYDPNLDIAHAFGVKGLPTSLLIDRAGDEIGRAEGALAWDSPKIEDRIEEIVEGRVESIAKDPAKTAP